MEIRPEAAGGAVPGGQEGSSGGEGGSLGQAPGGAELPVGEVGLPDLWW